MPDMSAVASLLSSISALKNIAAAMFGLRDAAAFQSKQIEFQAKLLDANNAAFRAHEVRSSLLERIRELETELAKVKAWECEKQRYELKHLGWGAFAYMLKPSARGTEPPHRICTDCFEHDHKAIVQQIMVHGKGQIWMCPACKNAIHPSIGTIEWMD